MNTFGIEQLGSFLGSVLFFGGGRGLFGDKIKIVARTVVVLRRDTDL